MPILEECGGYPPIPARLLPDLSARDQSFREHQQGNSMFVLRGLRQSRSAKRWRGEDYFLPNPERGRLFRGDARYGPLSTQRLGPCSPRVHRNPYFGRPPLPSVQDLKQFALSTDEHGTGSLPAAGKRIADCSARRWGHPRRTSDTFPSATRGTVTGKQLITISIDGQRQRSNTWGTVATYFSAPFQPKFVSTASPPVGIRIATPIDAPCNCQRERRRATTRSPSK